MSRVIGVERLDNQREGSACGQGRRNRIIGKLPLEQLARLGMRSSDKGRQVDEEG
jgi:hypothetical protein